MSSAVPASTPGVEIRLLGPVEVACKGRLVPIRGTRQRELLALLAIDAGRVVTAARLREELWGGSEGAAAALHTRISQLRTALGPVGGRIETHPLGYVLQVPDDAVDATRFAAGVRQARQLLGEWRHAEAAGLLREALALWRGPALAGLEDRAFAAAEAARLEEERLLANEALFEAELAGGRAAETVPELAALAAEHPARERLLELLMLALYRSGRQVEALEAFRTGRAALVDSLGIEPGVALRRLEQAILRQDTELDMADQQPRAHESPSPEQAAGTASGGRYAWAAPLPAPASTFVGREAELARVGELLGSGSRLVTLVGPGGAGKTRLAIEAARASLPSFGDRVAYVPLASLGDERRVLTTMARALGVNEEPTDPVAAIAGRVAGVPALVVLDNLEHLIGAVPELARLLTTAPTLAVLATSREALRIDGEIEVALGPMLPDDAAQLYLVRAAAVRSGIERSPAVDELCAHLDGLPLALELAAARAKVLGPSQLLARLGERLDLLRAGRDVDARQLTLRATLGWSHDLLSDTQQRLFRRLAVFAGGFTLESAELVCDADPETLEALVDKSLVVAFGDRHHLLETIRAYALELLESSGELEELTARFLDAMLAPIEEGMPDDRTFRSALVARYDGELDNLRAALALLVERDPRRLLERMLLLQFALEWQGLTHEAMDWAVRIVEAARPDDDRLRARALACMINVHQYRGELVEARRTGEEALALAAADDLLTRMWASYALAGVHALLGELARARELAGLVAEHLVPVGDPLASSIASDLSGLLAWLDGDAAVARALLAEGARRREQADIPAYFAHSSDAMLSAIDLDEGLTADALARTRRSLAVARARGIVHLDAAACIVFAACALARLGEVERAARLVGFFATLGYPPHPFAGLDVRFGEETLALAGAAVGPEGTERLVALGARLAMHEALDLALAAPP